VRNVDEILKDMPFNHGRDKDRQENVLAVYLYEKLGGTRKRAYKQAEISETAAISIDEAYREELTPSERTRLMRYLSSKYEELAEQKQRGENQ
jgi:hypothetical protein